MTGSLINVRALQRLQPLSIFLQFLFCFFGRFLTKYLTSSSFFGTVNSHADEVIRGSSLSPSDCGDGGNDNMGSLLARGEIIDGYMRRGVPFAGAGVVVFIGLARDDQMRGAAVAATRCRMSNVVVICVAICACACAECVALACESSAGCRNPCLVCWRGLEFATEREHGWCRRRLVLLEWWVTRRTVPVSVGDWELSAPA